MFSDIKSLHVGEAPTSSTAVYTAPATSGLRAQISGIFLHNTGELAASIALFHNHATNNRRFNVTLLPSETLELGHWQLENGQAIYAHASAAGINIFIEGREKTEIEP